MKIKLTTLILTLLLLATPMAQASQQIEMVEIPVLKERLKRFETITPSMISWRTMAKTRIPSNTVRDDAALIGMQAVRNISANAMVYEHSVRMPPDVSKNNEVIVVINQPGISVKMKCKALQDGLIGDSVRILNTRSNKIFVAEIVDTNKVTVN